MLTTIIYALRAKGATIDPTQNQRIELLHAPFMGKSMNDVRDSVDSSQHGENVVFRPLATVTVGESVSVEPVDAEAQGDEGLTDIMKKHTADGLSELIGVMQKHLHSLDIEYHPSMTEFLETCTDQKTLMFKIEEVNLQKDTLQSEIIDVTGQLRLDCIESYTKSITHTQ